MACSQSNQRLTSGSRPYLRAINGLLLLHVLSSGGLNLPGATLADGNEDPHRFLLIIETSRAMQRRTEGVRDTINHLLSSAMQGQLKSGDSIGLWTFSDDLYSGQFPLQRWAPESGPEVAARLNNFLSTQTNSRPARMERILEPLAGLVEQSASLTVVLICSGEQFIAGTPFDEPINQCFKAWQAEQQGKGMPFLAVLRAKAGKCVAYAVTAAPWPLEMPPLVREITKPRNNPAAIAKSPTPTKELVQLPPLIISGKKHEQELAREESFQIPVLNAHETSLQQAVKPVQVVASVPTPSEPIQRPATHEGLSPEKVSSAIEAANAPASKQLPLSPVVVETNPVQSATTERARPLQVAEKSEIVTEVKATSSARLEPENSQDAKDASTSPGTSLLLGAIRFSGVGIALTTFIALVCIFRRNRSAPGGSLITRSIERGPRA